MLVQSPFRLQTYFQRGRSPPLARQHSAARPSPSCWPRPTAPSFTSLLFLIPNNIFGCFIFFSQTPVPQTPRNEGDEGMAQAHWTALTALLPGFAPHPSRSSLLAVSKLQQAPTPGLGLTARRHRTSGLLQDTNRLCLLLAQTQFDIV